MTPGIIGARQLHRGAFVSYICNGQCILVRIEAYFPALMLDIRSIVNNTLGVVGVTVGAKATGRGRIERVLNVDYMQTPTAIATVHSHRVGITAVLVDNEIVGGQEAIVIAGFSEVAPGADNISQLGQIKDLHTTVVSFGDDKGMVVVHLDIPPGRV